MVPKGEELLNYVNENDINNRIAGLEQDLTTLQKERDALVQQHLASISKEQDKFLPQENDLLTDHLTAINKKEGTNSSISQLLISLCPRVGR